MSFSMFGQMAELRTETFFPRQILNLLLCLSSSPVRNNIIINMFRDTLIRLRLGINELGVNKRFLYDSFVKETIVPSVQTFWKIFSCPVLPSSPCWCPANLLLTLFLTTAVWNNWENLRCLLFLLSVQFTSLQLKMCARKCPYVLHLSPQRCLWKGSNVRLFADGPFLSFQGRLYSASSFHVSLLQTINGVMCLVLCPHIVSQSSKNLRSSEKQATCESCIVRIISLNSGMSRAVHPREFSEMDVDRRHIPVWASHSTFHFL